MMSRKNAGKEIWKKKKKNPGKKKKLKIKEKVKGRAVVRTIQ